VLVRAQVPGELLRPVPEPRTRIAGQRDLVLALSAHRAALREANGQIVAVACILRPEEVADPRACGTDAPR